MLQESFKWVQVDFRWVLKWVSRVFETSFKGVFKWGSRKYPGCSKEIFRVSQGSFKVFFKED